jgi:hypothetical protein
MCVVQTRTCDIRSSDMYILSKRAFQEFSDSLERNVVDMEAIQSLGSVWYVKPRESYQSTSSQLLGSQLMFTKLFMRLCRTQGG